MLKTGVLWLQQILGSCDTDSPLTAGQIHTCVSYGYLSVTALDLRNTHLVSLLQLHKYLAGVLSLREICPLLNWVY